MSRMETTTLKVIARIHGDLPTKFGIPRQSGLVESLQAKIIFEPEFRQAESLRGLEDFSHIWLIWGFSENIRENWSPTVRPPRLGGNTRMGVFATRSSFRPNGLGLSCVKLEKITHDKEQGDILVVSGADLMDGTPIYDIKPYIPVDCHPEASKGFTSQNADYTLEVSIPENLLSLIPPKKRDTLRDIIAQDPRPAYHDDEERTYGFPFAGYEVKFKVQGKTATVTHIEKK